MELFSAALLRTKIITKSQSTSYGVLWLARAVMFASMRHNGIDRLLLTPTGAGDGWQRYRASETVMSLQSLFPDQGGLLLMAAKLLGLSPAKPIADLCSGLNFQGPVELLTCCLCFCKDARWGEFSFNASNMITVNCASGSRSLTPAQVRTAALKLKSHFGGVVPNPLPAMEAIAKM